MLAQWHTKKMMFQHSVNHFYKYTRITLKDFPERILKYLTFFKRDLCASLVFHNVFAILLIKQEYFYLDKFCLYHSLCPLSITFSCSNIKALSSTHSSSGRYQIAVFWMQKSEAERWDFWALIPDLLPSVCCATGKVLFSPSSVNLFKEWV